MRVYYLNRENRSTFRSVILAGVHDVRNLRQKIRSDEEHKHNSPWNIAAPFDVDMSFSPADISGMLRDYEKAHQTGMNISEMSQLIYDYTSGYPVLVSGLCKIIDEIISGTEQFPSEADAWTKKGFLEADKILMLERTPLFESLINKLEDNKNLRNLMHYILFEGKSVVFNPDDSVISSLYMYGFVKNQDNIVTVSNRIFETRIYEWMLSRELTEGKTEKNEIVITEAINFLSEVLSLHYETKVIILLDEYDTPLQESYVSGFWDETVQFMRLFFNNTFKSNNYLYRAAMTGITRVSKESLFSDLNNLELCTMSSEKYQEYFGFTQQEVFDSMDEFRYSNKDEVKFWYDGFTIGKEKDIYNPWSIINFLDKGVLKSYWSNTSSNGLVNKLIRESDDAIKTDFEELLRGETIEKTIDDEMVFSQLDGDVNAIWSLLASAGYLKMEQKTENIFYLQIVNYEVMTMFNRMVSGWFTAKTTKYSYLIKSMLNENLEDLNEYMNMLTESMMSYFDTADNKDDYLAPEKFYHGFVLGLLVELRDRYSVQSNRESGIGRYDVMLIPKNIIEDKAFIIEFKKVNKRRGEKCLEDALENALKQIEDNKYEQQLINLGIPNERIVKYGFAFEGKEVLIG